MTRDIKESVSLLQRLEKVERENRRFKVLGSVMLLGMAGVLCLGLASNPSKKLEAEVLVLKSAQGKSQMILGAGDDGPALTILDKNGKLRVNLGVGQDGPALDLLDLGKCRDGDGGHEDRPEKEDAHVKKNAPRQGTI